MATQLPRLVAVAFALLVAASCSGYEVEELGNSADVMLDELVPDQPMTFGEILDVPECDRVEVVGPYTSSEDQEKRIGDADVDLSYTDAFVVLVAFDADDNPIRAVRLSRTPVDLDWIAPASSACNILVSVDEQGQVTRGGIRPS